MRCPTAAAETTVGASLESRGFEATGVAAPSDENVRQAVASELQTDRHLVASGIAVAVHSGIVELTGTVPALSGRERAARVAAAVRGVRAIVNRVRVATPPKHDKLVASDVRAALQSTVALANMPIGVRVADGVAELSGSISTWDEQQLAGRVVRGVPGVRFCENELTWRRSIKRSSAVITADVRSRLDWDPLVEHASIWVSARGKRVSLAGTIGSPVERKRAIALAWVKGVISVDAKALVIDPKHRPDANVRAGFPTDADISATIVLLGPELPSSIAGTWTASVIDSVVTLRGTVPTPTEKIAVDGLVRSVVGVTDVRNEISGPWVKSVAPPVAIERR
jgi:osmotically-inducible protein OsmY